MLDVEFLMGKRKKGDFECRIKKRKNKRDLIVNERNEEWIEDLKS
jgi:hypothetical protein